MIKVTFPDNSVKEYQEQITAAEIAAMISPNLRKKTVCAKVNDELYDLNRPIVNDCRLELITKENPIAFDVLNHSTAHLLAQAVKRLYPNAKFGIGPTIEEGFYYDIDFGDVVLSTDDLDKIEKYLARSITLTIDEDKGKPKKIQTNSLYGELRGNKNGKQD